MEEQTHYDVTQRAAEDSFQVMDRFDDEIIEAELKNRVIDTWSYSFKGSDGRLQEGLSKVGVDEACVEMSKRGYIIREGVVSMQTDPTDTQYILFQVPASLVRITSESKEVLMDVVNGTKRQWIKMKLRSGQIVNDPFWYEKGAMKAARNARSRLIPSETKARILLLARQKNKTRSVDETSTETSQTAPQSKKADKPIGEHSQKGKDSELRVQLKGYAKADSAKYFEIIGAYGCENADQVEQLGEKMQKSLLGELATYIEV
jgi:hypothetical protein